MHSAFKPSTSSSAIDWAAVLNVSAFGVPDSAMTSALPQDVASAATEREQLRCKLQTFLETMRHEGEAFIEKCIASKSEREGLVDTRIGIRIPPLRVPASMLRSPLPLPSPLSSQTHQTTRLRANIPAHAFSGVSNRGTPPQPLPVSLQGPPAAMRLTSASSVGSGADLSESAFCFDEDIGVAVSNQTVADLSWLEDDKSARDREVLMSEIDHTCMPTTPMVNCASPTTTSTRFDSSGNSAQRTISHVISTEEMSNMHGSESLDEAINTHNDMLECYGIPLGYYERSGAYDREGITITPLAAHDREEGTTDRNRNLPTSPMRVSKTDERRGNCTPQSRPIPIPRKPVAYTRPVY